MKKPLFVALVAVGAVTLAVARSSSAQDSVLAHVPFPFVVGGKVMPAGDYRVARDSNIAEHVLEIVSRDGRAEAFTGYDETGISGNSAAPNFEFKKAGSEYVLWRVSMPGELIYQIPIDRKLAAEVKYAKSSPDKGHKGL